MKRFKRLYAIVYGVLIAVLAVSTLCSSAIYSSWWFAALWAIVGGGVIWLMVRTRMWRRPGLFALHLSLPVILAGGAVTRLSARESTMILPPEMPVECLGLDLTLEKAEIEFYPGGEIARDYSCELTVNGRSHTLSVNSPVSAYGCRLYLQSFLPDGGVAVTVRKDAAGTAVSFIGYGLFLLGGVLCMLPRRFRMLILTAGIAFGAEAAVPVVNRHAADSLARKQVVYQGRVTTFSTVAHDALLKIYGKRTYKGLSAERVIISLTAFPDEWNDRPIIKTASGFRSLADCFDPTDGHYLLADDVRADERVGIILMLRNGTLFSEPGPEDELLSPTKVEAEILYNKVPWTMIAFIAFFIAAAVSFFTPKGRWLGWVALALQSLLIAAECWLAGHGPFVSMFETLQLLAAVVALMALTIRGALGPGLLASGCMALVAHLQAINPVVTPLMPVLHSPWLSLHVTLVMLAYALFVMMALLAAKALITRKERDLQGLLRPAVWLLGLGIFSGAVWANESWGRYWGWDPKETWALITFMLYAVPLHLRKPSLWWYILPILSVAMTYFGVNYLHSLHAYT